MDFWTIWIPLTLPFGIAIAAYLRATSRHRSVIPAAFSATLVMWAPGTLGMTLSTALTIRVIVLDSAINLVAVGLATLCVAYLIGRRVREPAHQSVSAAA